MNSVVCLIVARCSSWGRTWKRHWYDKDTGDCYRCGINRNDA